MKILEQNEWVLLDEIIYYIASEEQFLDKRKEFLKYLQYLIPNDFAVFHLADLQGSHILTAPVVLLPDGEHGTTVIHNYIENYENEDRGKWMMMTGHSAVYRERDLVSDDTIRQTGYYNDTYSALGVEYSLQCVCAYKRMFLGAVILARSKEHQEFSEKEVYMMEILNKYLSLKLFQSSVEYGGENKTAPDDDVETKIQLIAQNYSLTKREIEVMGELIEGSSNQEICEKLCITTHTLRKHITNVYKKLGVNNRVAFMHKIWDTKI